jgi:hypothetical protein
VTTQRLEFRASDAREANLWITGINSMVSKFGFEGVWPSQKERQQMLDGGLPHPHSKNAPVLKKVQDGPQTPLAIKVFLRFLDSARANEQRERGVFIWINS